MTTTYTIQPDLQQHSIEDFNKYDKFIRDQLSKIDRENKTNNKSNTLSRIFRSDTSKCIFLLFNVLSLRL